MGGHSAWRKRVANGELAKGYSGAICRHRPHLGRKGKDLIKNRKGHIGGGNPKKKKKKKRGAAVDVADYDQVEIVDEEKVVGYKRNTPLLVLGATWVLVLVSFFAYLIFGKSRNTK